MHKNVHEKHMRRHMMETFCMNFWKKKKTIAKVIQASSSSYCEELKNTIELLLPVKVLL
jgi:L-2-hydroxyglutarate oxidase LhgO